MKDISYIFYKFSSTEILPFDLLLLADETIEAIEKYIYDSDIYVISEKNRNSLYAVVALYKVSNLEIEIKNIAVVEKLQGKGIGSYLLDEIKQVAKDENYKTIIVGTPDVSEMQIRFYEKNGFTKYDLREGFFIKNYSIPIIENGVQLKDMIMLKFDLK